MQRTFHDNFISTPVDSYFIRMIVLYTYERNITAINRRVMWREQFSSFITSKDKKWPSWWRAYATESSPALSRVNNSNCYNIPLKSAKTSGYDGKWLYVTVFLRINAISWSALEHAKHPREVIHFCNGSKNRRGTRDKNTARNRDCNSY